MLDAYLWGDVDRISPGGSCAGRAAQPSKPDPEDRETHCSILLGWGSGAVAAGFVGDDPSGRQLLRLLAEAGVSTDSVVTLTDRPTTTKTRVICGQHQMLRVDEEETSQIDSVESKHLLDRIRSELDAGVAAVILSDYAKGVLTESYAVELSPSLATRGLPVIVDPKGRSFAKYAGATTITPNFREFQLATGVEHLEGPEFLKAARRLRDELGLDFLVITCGDKGIKYLDGEGLIHHPAVARQVYDVSGAGDTVLATLTAALVAGLEMGRRGSTCEPRRSGGCGQARDDANPASRSARHNSWRKSTGHSTKVCDLATLMRRLADWRLQNERIVFTNGCFDLLHIGHVTLLTKAKQEGDRLIVGLNTDRSVRALKVKADRL